MSAAARLAKAAEAARLPVGSCEVSGDHYVYPPGAGRIATAILTADPHLAQDIEDGRALRELREALPDDAADDDWSIVLQVFKDGSLSLQVWNGYGWRNASEREFTEDSLTAAADKAREALEGDRG